MNKDPENHKYMEDVGMEKGFYESILACWKAGLYLLVAFFMSGCRFESQSTHNQTEIVTSRVTKTNLPEETFKSQTAVAELLKNDQVLAEGKVVFERDCSTCHGLVGGGRVGPNLTDNYWIHSKGDYAGILRAIVNGFPKRGMAPWGQVLPKDQLTKLTIYVLSLSGSKPVNGKAPQGRLIQEIMNQGRPTGRSL